MASLRKYRPREAPRKAFFSIDRTLLAGVVGFGALGLGQATLTTVASNDHGPAPAMMAQSPAPAAVVAARPQADFTPVGSIEKKPSEAPKPADAPAPNPHGLRLSR